MPQDLIRSSTRAPATGAAAASAPHEEAPASNGQPVVGARHGSAKLPQLTGAKVGGRAATHGAGSPSAPVATNRARRSTQPAPAKAVADAADHEATAHKADQAPGINPAQMQSLENTANRALGTMIATMNEMLDQLEASGTTELLPKLEAATTVFNTAHETRWPGSTSAGEHLKPLAEAVERRLVNLPTDKARKLETGLSRLEAENALTPELRQLLSVIRAAVVRHIDATSLSNERQGSRTLADEARAEHGRREKESAAQDAAMESRRDEALLAHARRA
jgi:hypothetical protein